MSQSFTLLACSEHQGHHNNLNALRLWLAWLVLFSHSFSLSLGPNSPDPISILTQAQVSGGGLAVDLFFFLSGLLVTASWMHSSSANDYLRRRILRILPGFIAAFLVSVVVMVYANSSELLPLITTWRWIKLAARDLVTLSDLSLKGPEVFPENPFPGFVNGSLWTIPKEFACYLLVAAIGIFCVYKKRLLILLAFAIIYAFYCKGILRGQDTGALDRRFLTFFMAGMCAWLWRDKVILHWVGTVLAFGLLLLGIFVPPGFALLSPLAAGYLALAAGYLRPISSFRWCDRTDLSYGVYLYAFPVQQLIAMAPVGRNPWLMCLAATPLTLGMAFLSWHLIEKRFLKMKRTHFTDFDPANYASRSSGGSARTVVAVTDSDC